VKYSGAATAALSGPGGGENPRSPPFNRCASGAPFSYGRGHPSRTHPGTGL
jgi:hypothetical protein